MTNFLGRPFDSQFIFNVLISQRLTRNPFIEHPPDSSILLIHGMKRKEITNLLSLEILIQNFRKRHGLAHHEVIRPHYVPASVPTSHNRKLYSLFSSASHIVNRRVHHQTIFAMSNFSSSLQMAAALTLPVSAYWSIECYFSIIRNLRFHFGFHQTTFEE